jgi:hypothetical protein
MGLLGGTEGAERPAAPPAGGGAAATETEGLGPRMRGDDDALKPAPRFDPGRG